MAPFSASTVATSPRRRVVVGIGESAVADYDGFYNALDERRAGDDVEVKLLRAGKVETARVKLTPQP